MATEQQYDDIVAPLLMEAAKKAEELGMSFVARVEWEPGEAGLTRVGDPKSSVAQAMTFYAAHARGNIDAMLMPIVRDYNVSESIFLARFNKHPADGR
jgi:hypothetical protein